MKNVLAVSARAFFVARRQVRSQANVKHQIRRVAVLARARSGNSLDRMEVFRT
jgi:hypothetical protein